MAKLASLQARRPYTKTAKANKDTQAKAKRLMREMLVFWKKNEREERMCASANKKRPLTVPSLKKRTRGG
jgi:DNA helicase INO80